MENAVTLALVSKFASLLGFHGPQAILSLAGSYY